MDEQKQRTSPSENDDVDLRPITADPGHPSSTAVFAGDPAQVRAGFALALQLLGFDAPMPEPCAGDRTGPSPQQ
jgi:hypothetical protein